MKRENLPVIYQLRKSLLVFLLILLLLSSFNLFIGGYSTIKNDDKKTNTIIQQKSEEKSKDSTLPDRERKTIELNDIQEPHQIKVDNDKIYIFDEADYKLHIYDNHVPLVEYQVGKMGDGPTDFKYLPTVFIYPESFICTDFTKTIWYSKHGDIIKIKEYSDFKDFDLDSEMLLIPVDENYLRITVNHDTQRRYVYLLDSEYKTIKMLYDGPFTWKAGEPVSYRIHIVYYEKMIFISDNQKGFYIEVFNNKGEHLYTINKNEEIDRIPMEGRENIFYPLLHHFQISDNKIYAITNKKIDNKNEIIILDLKGNILKRVFLPMLSKIPGRRPLRFDLSDIDQGKLYELIKNNETGKWALYITEL